MNSLSDIGQVFAGTATFYASRPGYPVELLDYVADLARRHSDALVLDLGTGPGVIAIELAARGMPVVAVDPSTEMLNEGRHQAASRGVAGIEWLHGSSYQLPSDLGAIGVVTIGDACHWTSGADTLRALDRLVRPGGCVALLSHRWPGFARPSWDVLLRRVRERHLGPRRHAGPTGGFTRPTSESHEEAMRNSVFSRITRNVVDYDIDVSLDQLLAWQFSQAHSSFPVLGDQREAYEQDLRNALNAFEPAGRFIETSQAHLLIGRRPPASPSQATR